MHRGWHCCASTQRFDMSMSAGVLIPGTDKQLAGRAAVTDHTMVWPPGGTPAAAGLRSRLSKAKAVFRGRQPSARKD